MHVRVSGVWCVPIELGAWINNEFDAACRVPRLQISCRVPSLACVCKCPCMRVRVHTCVHACMHVAARMQPACMSLHAYMHMCLSLNHSAGVLLSTSIRGCVAGYGEGYAIHHTFATGAAPGHTRRMRGTFVHVHACASARLQAWRACRPDHASMRVRMHPCVCACKSLCMYTSA